MNQTPNTPFSMQKIKEILSRPQVWGFFLSVAIMAAIALLFFYPDNIEGRSLRQPDMVQGAANGHEGQAWEEATGEKALWTNSLFGGMPTFQIAPSYPSNSLFDWVNTVYGLGLPAPSNLLFMMMAGFFILMYCLRKRWYYALIGAIAWGFSSYFIIIIGAGHIWKFVALTYVPPTIGGLILLYRGRYLAGTAITAAAAMMQLAANHPQMSYYFGLLMAILAICYLVEAIRKKTLRRWAAASGLALGAGLLALAANSPSLYNTYEYSKETKRATSELTAALAPEESQEPGSLAERPTGGMPKSQILGWSYGRSELFSLLIPNIKGGASAKPEHGQNVMVTLSELDGAQALPADSPERFLLDYLPQYFNDSEGTNGPVYVGAIIAALFILGCCIVRGPLKWAMIAGTALSCLLALGYNAEAISDMMIYHFPLYNKFRAVESILVVAEFCMPLLAVLALCTFAEAGAEAWKRWRKPLCFSFGVPAAICLLALLAPKAFGSMISSVDMDYQDSILRQLEYYYTSQGATDQQTASLLYEVSLSNPRVGATVESLRAGMVRADALRSFLFLAFAFVVLGWFGYGKMRKPVAVALVGFLIFFDLAQVDKRYLDSDSFTEPVDGSWGIEPDAIDRAILADTSGHYRVLDMPGFDSPRRSYFHKMLGGYHAAKLNRYEDVINYALAPARRGFDPTAPSTAEEAAAMKVADMLNARYIITSDRSKPLVRNSAAYGNAWLVDSVVHVHGALEEMHGLLSADTRRAAVIESAFADAIPASMGLADTDTIALTSYSPNTLTYTARSAQGALAVFSEVYFPWGWKATIDGEPAPLLRANYILRAMAIPAGTHQIAMTFAPDSLKSTTAVAYASISLIYLLIAAGAFLRIRRWWRC